MGRDVLARPYDEQRRLRQRPDAVAGDAASGVRLRSHAGNWRPAGQIKLRRIDGWQKIAGVLSQHTAVAA